MSVLGMVGGLVGLISWKRHRRAIEAFTESALPETAKELAAGAVAVLSPGMPIVGPVASVIAKELVTAVAARAPSLERSVERLLAAPLIAGIRLLRDACEHEGATEEQRRARDELLDDAHARLTDAWAFAGDSKSDALLIEALDVLTLAMRRGHAGLAQRRLARTATDVTRLREQADALTERAKWLAVKYRKAEAVFRPQELTDKPFGWAEQRGYLKWREAEVRTAARAADIATKRVALIEAILAVAKRVVEHAALESG